MKPLRHLLLATLEDTSNPNGWSGTPFALRRALESRLERVTVLDNLPVKRSIGHGFLRLCLRGAPPRWPLWATDPALKAFGSSLQEATNLTKPDAVLSLSSQCLVYYQPTVPTGMFSDSPWIAWKHAYRNYELTPLSGAAFARKEASAAKKCNAILFASDWAIKQGQKLYGISDHRFYLCPFGATRVPDLNWEQLTERVKFRNQEYLHILFIGKDWDRKGGPLAVEITRSLNAMGVQSFLDIVGCRPAISKADRFVRIHGLIRGEDPRESKRLQDLFLDSNFLLVPTNAECFGIVFAEAAAHCLPAVSQMVQAVPSIVIDGETGILQHPKASAQSYARRIIDVFRDESRYLRMALAARKRYEENFTWDICARRAITALEEHLK